MPTDITIPMPEPTARPAAIELMRVFEMYGKPFLKVSCWFLSFGLVVLPLMYIYFGIAKYSTLFVSPLLLVFFLTGLICVRHTISKVGI